MKKEEVIKFLNPSFYLGVAHRGLHDEKNSENGMNAFKNAIKNKCAFEFDCHLTKDKEVVICHDSDLKRVTGKEGIIEELTLKDIKENYRLSDGGEIPTLKEVLSLYKENETPFVLELKEYKKNFSKLTKQVEKLLSEAHVNKKDVIIISFYPTCLPYFRKKKYIVCLLISERHPELFNIHWLYNGLDIDQTFFTNSEKYKNTFKNLHNKTLMMSWTIKDKETLIKIHDFIHIPTFENISVSEVREIYKGEK